MVSTRGIKLKFFEGERVLCYEPDPTKAKVLYDSKVLDVVINKDHRGKKTVEYLIHFQGWNSSWDRCVSEEYVLKDTAENRQLQKDLAEKSQLQLGAYLYRKERKKSRKTSERASASEDGSSGSPARMDTDDGQGVTSSSEDDSSTEEDIVHIELTDGLRQLLEADYYLINDKNKLMKLPTEPNVVTILETYYRHYATNQICGLTEKSNMRYRPPPASNHAKLKPEDINKSKLDGMSEKGKFETKIAVVPSPTTEIKNEIKTEDDEQNSVSGSNNGHFSENGSDGTKTTDRRKTLRSNRSDSQCNGNTSPPENCSSSSTKPGSRFVFPGAKYAALEVVVPTKQGRCQKLSPGGYFQNMGEQPPPPCLVYGATHLTRLFVKLPDMFAASTITEEKLKTILKHIDLLL
ncbi:hypothetical protein NQ317_015571, partial [Molorchus minor]